MQHFVYLGKYGMKLAHYINLHFLAHIFEDINKHYNFTT